MIRRAVHVARLSAVWLLVSSCFVADLFEPGPLMVVGHVYSTGGDPWPGTPTPGIVVRLRGERPDQFATTDASGRYEFKDAGNGYLQVSLVLDGGASHPASHAGWGGNGRNEGWDFQLIAGAGHSLSGTVEGPGAVERGVMVGLCCVSTAYAVVRGDGSFTFENLPLGYYDARGFFPSVAGTVTDRFTVSPVVDFTHAQAGEGTLGTFAITGITVGANDVSGCFEVLLGAAAGTGRIRPRSDAPNVSGPCETLPWYDIWYEKQPVTIAFSSALGPSAITLEPHFLYHFTPISPDFTFTSRLEPSTGIHLTMKAP